MSQYSNLTPIMSPEARAARAAELAEFERVATERAAALEREKAARRAEAEAEAAKRAAERERIGREWERIRKAWEDHLDTNGDGPYPGAGSIFDANGEILATVAGLKEFAAAVRRGQYVRGEEASEARRMRSWWVAGGNAPPEGSTTSGRSDFEPRDLHWVIAYDRKRTVPNLKGAGLREWAIRWRDGIQGLEASEVIVFPSPGEPVAFVTWWDEQRSVGQAQAWAAQISGVGLNHEDPRFVAVPDTPWHGGPPPPCMGMQWPWRVPCAPLYLPGGAAPADTDHAALLAALSKARLATGWRSFDALFRGKPGIPMGGRVLVAGERKHAKSLVLIDVARAAMALGFCVAWYAKDEPIGDVLLRRLQQLGLTPSEALEPPLEALARLNAQPFLIADQGCLEDFWARAYEWASGRPLVMVADSLQTLPSAAANGKGEREGIEALISAVIDLQATQPAIFIASSEITGAKRTPKGSGRIGYSFTTLLDVRRVKDRVTVTVGPSRHNAESSFELTADFDGQRLLDPAVAKAIKATAELRALIVATVVRLSTKATSQNAIAAEVDGVDSKRVHAEVKAMVADGALLRVGSAYRVP